LKLSGILGILLILLLTPLPIDGQITGTRTAKGQLYTLVLPVEFTDLVHSVSIQTLNQTLAKVASYYASASFGQAAIIGTVFPTWVRLPHNLAFYGADNNVGDDAAGNPAGSEQLVVDAISFAQAVADITAYRYVILVHAGADQATASPLERSPLIWSRTWIGKTFLPRGTDSASIVSEFSPYGVWAHELGHQTGHLPDMYDSADSSLHFMGTWSLMDTGAYLGQPPGNQPGLFDAWSRISLGWITPAVVENGNYNLIPAETQPSNASLTCCYALQVPIDSTSYFLVELRLRVGLDAAQRSQGVLIYLYNSSAKQGQQRVVDPHLASEPARGDLSNAAFSVGQSFSDTRHNILISIISSSASGYTVHVTSKVTYTISLVVPASVSVLTNQQFYVVFSPPIGGLELRIFLDNSKESIALSNTTSDPRYNFTLYLQPKDQGPHNLTAALTDSAGKTLASSSTQFTAIVPLWVTLVQPNAILAYVFFGVVAVLIAAVLSASRSRRREEIAQAPTI